MTNREQIAWSLGFCDYDNRDVAEILTEMLDAIDVYMDKDESKRLERWLALNCDPETNNWGIFGGLKMNEWISVKDRLPDEDDDVLLLVRETEFYGKHQEKRKVYRWIFTGWRIDGEWATTYCHGHKMLDEESKTSPNFVYAVTHWMPLPAPPEEEALHG